MSPEHLEPPDPLETTMLGERSLQDWHAYLTTDQRTGEPTGHLDAPCSRYGRNGDECAWAAIAFQYGYARMMGEPDDTAAALEYSMEKAVNDEACVADGLQHLWANLPQALRDKLSFQVEPDEEHDHVDGFQYDSPRDEVLHIMAENGWSNASSGHPFSPTGHFYRLSNTEPELLEVAQAFAGTLQQYDVDAEAVAGHHLLQEDYSEEPPRLKVTSYAARLALLAEFGQLRMEYEAWRAQEDELA